MLACNYFWSSCLLELLGFCNYIWSISCVACSPTGARVKSSVRFRRRYHHHNVRSPPSTTFNNHCDRSDIIMMISIMINYELVGFPNPLAPDTCQLGNPTTMNWQWPHFNHFFHGHQITLHYSDSHMRLKPLCCIGQPGSKWAELLVLIQLNNKTSS